MSMKSYSSTTGLPGKLAAKIAVTTAWPPSSSKPVASAPGQNRRVARLPDAGPEACPDEAPNAAGIVAANRREVLTKSLSTTSPRSSPRWAARAAWFDNERSPRRSEQILTLTRGFSAAAPWRRRAPVRAPCRDMRPRALCRRRGRRVLQQGARPRARRVRRRRSRAPPHRPRRAEG
jgi:hypothetical protein